MVKRESLSLFSTVIRETRVKINKIRVFFMANYKQLLGLSLSKKEILIQKSTIFNNQCCYCGVISPNLTIDHFIPKSKGGKESASNFLPSCSSCNLNKGCEMPDTWYKSQTFYTNERWAKIINNVDITRLL